ncbi:unnamed protein product [Cuscuta epithymum]|uniref:Uncharacterized protein n=1 Tax=Cuscuta epithymum TaxID=186058 RepID=A0AAV0C7H0_9ASTE|nr:unnamed protein product [Cuscuta epithymum]CAH9132322.1 unnamed protein product [Cuscuta epithymum]
MNTPMLYSPLFFLCLSLLVPFVFSRQFPTSPPVVDADGKELKLNAAYYAISAAFFHLEGLCLVNVNNNEPKAHPHDVVQCNSTKSKEAVNAFPVIFSAVDDTEDPIVRENVSYTVKFSVNRNVSNETVWTFGEAHNPLQKFVTTNPKGPAIQFQAQKVGFGYKIVHCVVIPIPRTPVCYNIGFIPDFGYNRLGIGLGLEPVKFFFKNNVTAVNNTATY